MAGRRSKPHHTSWDNTPIPGLVHDTDGRWRIVKTGKKFTEHDERRDIERFRRWERQHTVNHVDLIASLSAATGIEMLELKPDPSAAVQRIMGAIKAAERLGVKDWSADLDQPP